MSKLRRVCLSLLLFSPVSARAQQPAPPPATPQKAGVAADAAEGLIHLDVVVTDQSGKPVSGLSQGAFTLLDDGQPSAILSFRAQNGTMGRPDPPVEVILVLDTIDLPARLASYERREVERFLRQNGGHLAQPVSVFGLSDGGLWTLAEPGSDGNALAAEIAQNKELSLTRRALGDSRGNTMNWFAFEDPAGLSALKALGDIATAQERKPGRKLLIWVGPGSGVGSGEVFESPLNRQLLFDAVHWFSTLLRAARITLYSFSVGENDSRADIYKGFLDGVKSAQQVSTRNLDRKVLAVQSGGRVLVPTEDPRTDSSPNEVADHTPASDLVSEMNRCVEEASAFYTLSFDPPHANGSDEYHDLRVQVAGTELTARTAAGYYDQPYFYDQPARAARPVTVEQVGQMLAEGRASRDADVARRLSSVDLTERLSDAKLASWQSQVRGAKARAALAALADASSFLDPPPAEILADAAPEISTQRRMIAQAVDYLSKTVPGLPNFFAMRTTIRYEETPEHYDQAGRNKIEYQPLHWANSAKATVLYRNGNEIVESGAKKSKEPQGEAVGLITEGTFGPILGAVTYAIAVPDGLTWSRWEQGEGGPRAVFRYMIPQNKSRFQVGYCCLLEGDGTTAFEELAGYHGEIAIDPGSGTILRLTLEADLQQKLPVIRSGVMVEYGPVEIGGKTYICPLRSVSISRSRTVNVLTGFSQSFRTFGPYSTMVNDVAFKDYHVFRAEVRVLTGEQPPLQ